MALTAPQQLLFDEWTEGMFARATAGDGAARTELKTTMAAREAARLTAFKAWAAAESAKTQPEIDAVNLAATRRVNALNARKTVLDTIASVSSL